MTAVAFGLVSLRRRTGGNWPRSDVLQDWPSAPAGEHVARVFAGRTLVEGLTDDALLDLVVAPVAGLRLDETRSFDDGRVELVAAAGWARAAAAAVPRRGGGDRPARRPAVAPRPGRRRGAAAPA